MPLIGPKGCMILILAYDWSFEAPYSKTSGQTSTILVIKQNNIIFMEKMAFSSVNFLENYL